LRWVVRSRQGREADMTLHGITLAIHVMTAILGVGQVAAIATLAASPPAGSTGSTTTWKALGRLAMAGSLSLAVMLITGLLLDYSVGGGYHHYWWFRISFLAFVVLGGLLGWTRRTVRKNVPSPDDQALSGVRRAAWLMCAIIAFIAVLMQAKPW
jgi:hypothetical protein